MWQGGDTGHGMSDQQHSPHQVDSATALKVRKQPQPGDVLDGTYRLDQQLGKGGVGVVYRAFHLHLQRDQVHAPAACLKP
jgi:serine/threonine protein kinase